MVSLQNFLCLRRRSTLSIFLIFFLFNPVLAQQKEIAGTKPDTIILGDNSVNIGYGIQKGREVTSSITTIIFSDFNKGNTESPVQLIQGKVAGLSICKPGSDPNGVYDMRMRGINTINGNTLPLVVIDGVPGGSLNNVDPNEIESFTVLKDGAAAAIYGTRGSGGVILVTTKKGKSGKAVIDYNVYTSAEMVAKNTPVMNASEWRALSKETGLGTDFGSNTDWFKEIERTAISQVHNISMSGGTNKTSYRASVNLRSGDGVLINTGYKQINGRFNLRQKALNDRFTIDLDLAATDRESRYGFADAFRYAAIFNPTATVISSDPANSKYDGYFQQVLFDYYNPVSILELNKNEGKDRIMNISLKGTYEIFQGMHIDALYANQSIGALKGRYFDIHDFYRGINWNGLASRQGDNYASRLFESTAHFNRDITSSLNISALGGYSFQDFTNDGVFIQAGNFLTDAFSFNNLAAALDFKNGIGSASSYKDSNKLIAFFGRINMSINTTWFLTASARYEGSSRFGSNHKWGLFPAFGAGVDLSKLTEGSFIDNLKVRANYGITGNQPSNSYESLFRMSPQNYAYYNGTFVPGYYPQSNANPDLKWESHGEFDLGFDFSLFKSKVNGSFDYYTSTTTDLLYKYTVPSPPNVYNQTLLNLGKLSSSGMELTLNCKAIQKSDLTYSLSFTSSLNFKNKLNSLSDDNNGVFKVGTQDIGDMGSPGGAGVALVRVEEGKPIGQLLAWVYNGIGEDGRMILVDTDKNGYIDYDDAQIVGNGLPKMLIGFGNSINYKNLDLNIFFRGVFGHDLVNSFRSIYEAPVMISYYNLPKTASDMRNSTTGILMTNGAVRSSYDVENASFVSLDNLCLGYNFRLSQNAPFSKIRLYLAANNLFYITKYKGSDPSPRYGDSEYSTYNPLIPGIDRRNTWCRTRSVTLGANIVF